MAEKMTVFERAKKYYPRLWDIERIKNLCGGGKITKEQYKEITGEEYK